MKNIRQSKLNDPARIDIIAIQEVKDVTLQLPQQLVNKLNMDGSTMFKI